MNDWFKNGLILVLVIFNIFFLYKNKELRDQFRDQRTKIPVSIENNYEGLEVNKSAVSDLNQGIKVITFIWEIACSSCITHEIDLLNKYYSKFGNNIKVVFVANSQNAKLPSANFPYLTINKSTEVLNRRVEPQNPFSIVFDDNFIYKIRKVKVEQPFSKVFSEHLYKNQLRFLNEIK